MNWALVLSRIPAGSYAVGMSGGADSTALLLLLREHRPELGLHVVHLNHETRGEASDADAAFVERLAGRLKLPATIARRREVEPLLDRAPSNPSALYRALRHRLFANVVGWHGLEAVLLAHHALDQAETVLHRLLRGSGPSGLAGMEEVTRLRVRDGGMLVVRRPLLGTPAEPLRQYLVSRGEAWREDASNRSARYFRGRLRPMLAERPELVEALCGAGRGFGALRDWVRATAPALGESFEVGVMAALPELLAGESARRFLAAAGSPMDDLTPAVVSRLVAMARDAGSPPRQHFPGNILIRRRRGRIWRSAQGQ